MRNDHVFYGNVGGRYPTHDEIEHHLQAARALRSEALHHGLRRAREWLVAAFRRRVVPGGTRPAKVQHC